MDLKKKEEKVKELYEKYPYPARKIISKSELEYFAQWVATTFGEKKEFWKGKTVLELGCGTGELANSLALCGAKITAIDFSAASIKHAKKISQKLKTQHEVKFIEKNILSLSENEFNGKKFDAVIALGSLHHTINALEGFKIACKFAKPNGLVVIGLYNKYARLRHLIRRSFLRITAGDNIEKRIELGKKFFGTKNKQENDKTWFADKYGSVHESHHSINEVLYWFKQEGIEFISSKPKFERAVIDELTWLFEKRGAFFVMSGKKNKKTSQ